MGTKRLIIPKKDMTDYETIRKEVVNAVIEKHKMTMTEFSESKLPKSLKIPGGSTLRSYMSGSSVSFPVMQKLAESVGIKIRKKTVVERKTYYYLSK